MATSQNLRNIELASQDIQDRPVQSVSISRRSARRTDRVSHGGKRTVARSRRRFAAILESMFTFPRLRGLGLASVRPKGTPWTRAKIAGIMVISVAVGLLALIYSSDSWYVYAEDVHFRNLSYLQESDVYRSSGIEGWHVFWLTPDQVSKMVEQSPYIEQAKVAINLPLRVSVDVKELQPIALWVTKDATYWLTEDGKALPAIAATDKSMPQIIDVLGEAKAIGAEGDKLAVNPKVMESALSLMQEMPELENKIRYNRNFGLNFPLTDEEVWVYWGDGQNTAAKMKNLLAAKSLLPDREEPASLIDVRFIQRPYIR